MKKILFGIFSILIVVVIVQIIFTIQGRNIRQTELDNAVTSSMEKALEMLNADRTVAPKSQDEWEALFIESLSIQIESDSELTVNILDADMEKGLLSVEAILTFKHPIGTTGSVRCVKTAILEQYETDASMSTYTLTYIVEGTVYKVYELPEGSIYKVPTAPVVEGKLFKGWRTADSEAIVDVTVLTLENDVTYYAVFE